MSAGRPHSNTVVVIGGGPAGLAAAIATRLTGLDVAVVDHAAPLIDRVCGEGLMPDGAQVLNRLGVRVPMVAVRPFRGIRYIQDDIDVTGRFRHGPGLGMRRPVLHEALIERALELGVRLHWRTRVEKIAADGVHTAGGFMAARWVVAADGNGSSTRRQLGLHRPARYERIGRRAHYEMALWNDLVEVHWADGCEMYVTPVGPQLLCVSMLTSQRDLSFDAALTRFPRLAARLCGAARVSDPRGAGTAFRPLAEVVRGHVALLGDASGTVDAITGDGVTVALHQAVALAGALASGSLTPYARAHRRIMRLPFLMTAAMLAIHRRPRLRRQTLRLLAAAPAVFRGLLAVHTRSLPLQRRVRFLRGLHGVLASSIPGGGDADAARRNG